jgi:hypothetical protein
MEMRAPGLSLLTQTPSNCPPLSIRSITVLCTPYDQGCLGGKNNELSGGLLLTRVQWFDWFDWETSVAAEGLRTRKDTSDGVGVLIIRD